MSQATEIARKRVLYAIPGMDAVRVQRDVSFSGATGVLHADIYSPHDVMPSDHPAVILVTGYRDAGCRSVFGCAQKEMGAFVSWAELIAASGLAAITYTNIDPVADLLALFKAIEKDGLAGSINARHLTLYAASGHGQNALSLLMGKTANRIRCAVLSNPGRAPCRGLQRGYPSRTTYGQSLGPRENRLNRSRPVAH